MADNSNEKIQEPVHVVFLIDHFKNQNAGTEGQLYLLVKSLVAVGVRCHLGVLRSSDYLEQGCFPCPFTVIGHTHLGSIKTWHAVWKFGLDMRKKGYKLAHVYFNDVSVLAPPMLGFAGLKTIISRRDMGFWYNTKYRLLLRLTRFWVAACVTNSQAVADVTMQVEKIPRGRMHTIYNGLQVSTNVKSQIDVLATLKLNNRLLAGIVANIRPIKRIDDLIDALVLLASDHPRLDLVIIGAGDPSLLLSKAHAHGLQHRVHFLGPQDDIPSCLQYLDVGVLCSESEGFSNALVEYMQAGLPSICSRSGGNPEAIHDNCTGLLYPVGDVQALAKCLDRLCADDALRTSMGEKAYHEAEVRFSMDAMLTAHRDLYTRLLDGS